MKKILFCYKHNKIYDFIDLKNEVSKKYYCSKCLNQNELSESIIPIDEFIKLNNKPIKEIVDDLVVKNDNIKSELNEIFQRSNNDFN